MNDLGTNISLYADDAVLYSSDDNHSRLKSHLETLLMAINNWSKLNYINLNVQKTKFCIYSYRSHIKKFQDTTLKACDQEIFRCHQYNYLGVLLDECMTLTPNFDSIFKKFSYKIFQFGKSYKYMDTNTRFLVYKQTILPLVEYVSFMLCMNNVSEADMLQKLQNRCLRFCLEIGNPIELSVDRLHQIARVNKLDLRRDVQLLSLMFSLKMINMYRKDGVCVPHNIDRYTFVTVQGKSKLMEGGTKLGFHLDCHILY